MQHITCIHGAYNPIELTFWNGFHIFYIYTATILYYSRILFMCYNTFIFHMFTAFWLSTVLHIRYILFSLNIELEIITKFYWTFILLLLFLLKYVMYFLQNHFCLRVVNMLSIWLLNIIHLYVYTPICLIVSITLVVN